MVAPSVAPVEALPVVDARLSTVGVLARAVISAASGKAKKVHPLMWVVTAGFIIYFARGPINALMGV